MSPQHGTFMGLPICWILICVVSRTCAKIQLHRSIPVYILTMDTEIIKRYNKEPNGPYLIDIMVDRPEHIFTEYDGVIAWNRKDLDEDFDRYLMACVDELESLPWAIRISLRAEPDDGLEKKIIYAIRNFYSYKQKEIKRTFMGVFRRTLFSGALGFSILTAITIYGGLFDGWGHAGEIAKEGLHVAIWVTIWHAIADTLYEIGPTRKKLRHSKMAAEARISFRYPDL